MSDHPHTPPFKLFGRYLKTMRQKLQESLGETSSAVEIEVERLDRFERGVEVPSEDILLLLISHFGLRDDEAVKLWELAGYSRDDQPLSPLHDRQTNEHNPRAMQVTLVAFDNRALYTNGVEILSDDSGMLLNFLQSVEPNQPSFVAARIGMSHQQAEKLVETLERALLHKKYLSGPRHLPAPDEAKHNQQRTENQEKP